MEPKGKIADHLGPINPFTLGTVFIEAVRKLGWVVEEQEERQRRYFNTSKGFEEMGKLGMDLERVLHYRASESRQEDQAPSRQHRRHTPRRR